MDMKHTETHAQMVVRLFKEMGSPEATRIHAAVGISGEAAELMAAYLKEDPENFKEEGGDLLFYVVKLLDMHGWTVESVVQEAQGFQPCFGDLNGLGLIYEAGNVLDVLKKSWVYGKELNEQGLKESLGRLMHYFLALLEEWNMSLKEVAEANQYKLSTGPNARYPLGYTDAAAIARADKAPGQ